MHLAHEFLKLGNVTSTERHLYYEPATKRASPQRAALLRKSGGSDGKRTGQSARRRRNAARFPHQVGANVLGLPSRENSVYVDVTRGRFGFMGEFLAADVGRGASGARDAMPAGFYLQPSLLVTDTLELVMRYQQLDSDGRGVQLSDVMRSAPAGPTMGKFEGWYAGANWYLRGNDLKYQLGVTYGKTQDNVNGTPEEAKAFGVRSQMQMQF